MRFPSARVRWSLWLLAVATIATAFHRLYATWLKLKDTPPGVKP